MGHWFTRAQRSHRGRRAWPVGVREWCGRRERSERATVARADGTRRASALPCEPGRNGAKRSGGPEGVGAVSTCGTMPHHSGRSIC